MHMPSKRMEAKLDVSDHMNVSEQVSIMCCVHVMHTIMVCGVCAVDSEQDQCMHNIVHTVLSRVMNSR